MVNIQTYSVMVEEAVADSDTLHLSTMTVLLEETVDSLLPATVAVSPEVLYGQYTQRVSPAGLTQVPDLRQTVPGLFEGFFALGIIFLFLLLFKYIRNYFSGLLLNLFYFGTLKRQLQINSLSVVNITRTLTVFSIISIGYFGWLCILHHAPDDIVLRPWLYFLVAWGGLPIYFLLKNRLLRIVGYISKSARIMQIIIYFERLCIIACGLLTLPVALMVAVSIPGPFPNVLMIICFILIFLVVILYIVRVIRIFFAARISIFFLILYLCTFEIAPILLLHSFISSS